MEPITTAIVGALAAGATAGATEVGKGALVDAYKGLKGVLTKKFGKKEKLTEAVAALEESPDSKGRQMVLDEEVQTALAHKDSETLQAAQALLTAIKQDAKRTGATAVDLKEIEAKSLEINTVIASGTGVKVEKGKFEGDIKISNVKAGHTDPNA